MGTCSFSAQDLGTAPRITGCMLLTPQVQKEVSSGFGFGGVLSPFVGGLSVLVCLLGFFGRRMNLGRLSTDEDERSNLHLASLLHATEWSCS